MPLSRLNHDTIPTITGFAFGGAGLLMLLGGLVMVFSDPAGFALIAFGLVFIGGGYLAHRLFRTPEGQKAVTVDAYAYDYERPLGVQGTRSRSTQIYVDEDATEEEVEALRRAWLREQWADRPDWVEGRIVDQHARGGTTRYVGAVVWTVFALALIGGFMLWGDPPWLLLALPAGVALVLIVLGVRDYLRQRKFGASYFQMDATPAVLGERLTGTVETGVLARNGPDDGFTVRLACRDRYEERDSDGDRHLRVTTLWESEPQQVRPRTAPGLPRRLDVPVALDLPADAPPTTLGSRSEGIVWDLTVSADVPGLDYGATFRLPVVPPSTAEAFQEAADPTRS
ncbi:MAG: hypothetical protein GVY18_18375 [Bacteroidetes bacterium]|jgi:hypothetical protein|nr:hypothetical protein [Bacteroidota bacterium]